jgi:CheY-like chemotaxis protein
VGTLIAPAVTSARLPGTFIHLVGCRPGMGAGSPGHATCWPSTGRHGPLSEARHGAGERHLDQVCHALRTPLNVIIGFADMLEDPSIDVEERKDLAARVRAAATDLLGVVESELSAAESEARRAAAGAGGTPASGDDQAGSRRPDGDTPAPPVLVVEDDSDVRDSMVAVLEACGHPAVAAENGRAAFHALEAGLRPGLILLDLMMPVMNGWEFRSEQLRRSEFASIPTVVCSALRENAAMGASLRGAHFVAKPVDFDHLLDLVEGYCPRPGH